MSMSNNSFENNTQMYLEKVLLITTFEDDLSKNRPKFLFYLKDEAGKTLRFSDLDCVIFERIFSGEPNKSVITLTNGYDVSYQEVSEKNPLIYLYQSYNRLKEYFNKSTDSEEFRLVSEAIINQSSQYLVSYRELNPKEAGVNMYNLISNYCNHRHMVEYVTLTLNSLTRLVGDSSDDVLPYLQEYFNHFLKQTFLNSPPPKSTILGLWKDPLQTLYCPERQLFINMLSMLANIPITAELLLDVSSQNLTKGIDVERCLLGRILVSTHLPSGIMQKADFFNNMPMTVQDKNNEESQIWQLTDAMLESCFDIFMSIFRNSKVRINIKPKFMNWFGKCLSLNEGRNKLANALNALPVADSQDAGDGFFMNLMRVLFYIGAPLVTNPPFDRVLTVQLEYTNDKDANNEFLPSLYEETRVTPRKEVTSNAVNSQSNIKYTAITQLFYLLHKAAAMSFRVVHSRYMELNQTLHRTQDMYQELMNRSGSTPAEDRLKDMMSRQMSLYMSLGCSLRQLPFMQGAMGLTMASSRLLVQLAKQHDMNGDDVGKLEMIPEYVLDNIVDWVTFLRHFEDGFFETCNLPLEPLLELSIFFMGSTTRVNNPHLRSKLPAILECLIPEREVEPTPGSRIPTFYLRQNLFNDPNNQWILEKAIEALFSAFTSMELSAGQESVRFEEKFEYRRPMYACMKYFDGKPMFDQQIKKLEESALININDAEAPLYLKFLNLLTNDATFLLDEALSYLSQIKTKEIERINQGGKYQDAQAEAEFQHTSMLTSYHNSLGSDTVDQLVRMAKLTPDIMVHPVLVDRIACTLNHFLELLVGPKRSSYTVRDKEAYKFRPKELIQKIAKIYVYLGTQKEEFSKAVVNDGRSYSDDLLRDSASLISRLSMDSELAQSFSQLTIKFKKIAEEQNEEDENYEDAPEEFYDPIMGTLMKDPVTLPSSGVVIDRKTIYRHLLSDPTDPFNRQPLAMTDINDNEDLKNRINDWINEKKKDMEQ